MTSPDGKTAGFDAIDADLNTLVERKFGQGVVFRETLGGNGLEVAIETRARGILAQALLQVDAVKETGIKVRWEVQSDLGTRGIKWLFANSDDARIQQIEVVQVDAIEILYPPNSGN